MISRSEIKIMEESGFDIRTAWFVCVIIFDFLISQKTKSYFAEIVELANPNKQTLKFCLTIYAFNVAIYY